MKIPVNSHIIQIVINVLDVYAAERKEIAPEDYMKKILTAKDLVEDKDCKQCTELILSVCRHEPFLKDMIQHILQKDGDPFSLVSLYCIVFLIDEENMETMETAFRYTSPKCARHLLRFVMSKLCPEAITKIGCAHYDVEYVKQLVEELRTKIPLVRGTYQGIDQFIRQRAVKEPWFPTIPVQMNVLRKKIKPPPPPAPTPREAKPYICPRGPPKSTYVEDLALKSRLDHEKQINRDASLKLKEVSDSKMYRCAKIDLGKKLGLTRLRLMRLEEGVLREDRIPKKHIPRPVSPVEEPEVRPTFASVLRQGATIMEKEREKARFYNDLVAGACDSGRIYAWQDQIRQDAHESSLLDIKKKHLRGLLSREEAIVAKHHLVMSNQEKMIAFKREKESLERTLQDWKAEEEKKIKIKVEKSHEAAKAAKDASKLHLRRKNTEAQRQLEESRLMIKQELERRQKELQNKVCMIKEIRALQSMRQTRVKEYDETSTSGIGFLCEMSIAELKERLYILQVETREKLETKQNVIRQKKDTQKQHLENAKATISRYRAAQEECRKLPKISCTKEVEDTSDIVDLRTQLRLKREERMKIFRNP